MLIGLMSDTHDRIPAIAELLKRMTERGVGMVLHAGDFCSPFALKPFQDSNVALAGVFGVATAVGATVGPINTVSATHAAHGSEHPAEASEAAIASPTPIDVGDGYEVTRTAGGAANGEWTFKFTEKRDALVVHVAPYLG